MSVVTENDKHDFAGGISLSAEVAGSAMCLDLDGNVRASVVTIDELAQLAGVHENLQEAINDLRQAITNLGILRGSDLALVPGGTKDLALVFDNTNRGFSGFLTVVTSTESGAKRQNIQVQGVYTGTEWNVTSGQELGEDTGAVFSVTPAGQAQITLPELSGVGPTAGAWWNIVVNL